MHARRFGAALMGALLTCASAHAGVVIWGEMGDAPDAVPGQITVGPGFPTPLDAIIGADDFVGDTVDMYCIRIFDPMSFSATTASPATGFDTQLFLFTLGGVGVTHNDDTPGSGATHSTITGAFVPAPGLYVLAISSYDVDPLNPAGSEMWADMPFAVERAPDGPGAPGPLAGWSAGPDLRGYKIFLTGATFHEVPAPASGLSLGLLGLLAARRRR
jgi:hypothetical protein